MNRANAAPRAKRQTPAVSLGPIESGACYALDDFSRRSGLGRHALRKARRAGLRVTYAHGRAYIFGQHWLEYLAEQGAAKSQRHPS